MTALKALWKKLKGEFEEFTSELLETDFMDTARKLQDDADVIIDRVQREKSLLQTQIDALVRQVAEKDALIEAARVRAQKAHEIASTLRKELERLG